MENFFEFFLKIRWVAIFEAEPFILIFVGSVFGMIIWGTLKNDLSKKSPKKLTNHGQNTKDIDATDYFNVASALANRG